MLATVSRLWPGVVRSCSVARWRNAIASPAIASRLPATVVFSPGVVTDTWVAVSGSPAATAARSRSPEVSSSISRSPGLASNTRSRACRSARLADPAALARASSVARWSRL